MVNRSNGWQSLADMVWLKYKIMYFCNSILLFWYIFCHGLPHLAAFNVSISFLPSNGHSYHLVWGHAGIQTHVQRPWLILWVLEVYHQNAGFSMNNFFFEKLSLLLYSLKRMKKLGRHLSDVLLELTHTVQSTHLIDFQFVGETTDNNY